MSGVIEANDSELAAVSLSKRKDRAFGQAEAAVRFHLERLVAKTNTRRQSELVRLLLTTTQVGAGR